VRPPTQLTLFDRQEATRRRDAGMQRAEVGAPDDWVARAFHALVRAADLYPDFIVDDVWRLMDPADIPHEPRAMGPVMKAGQAAGLIVPTGEYRLSDRKTAHRNPRQVWRGR